MIYMDCLCIVETIDFDIKIVQIRVRMQKLEPSECSPARRRSVARPTRRHVWWVARVTDVLRHSPFCVSYLILEMTSDKKSFKMKVFRLVETVKIAFGLVSIRGRLLPQTWPARCSQVVNRTVLESSDKTSPNLTRVLDVNWCNFIVRKA